jgi:hypothetical protein
MPECCRGTLQGHRVAVVAQEFGMEFGVAGVIRRNSKVATDTSSKSKLLE